MRSADAPLRRNMHEPRTRPGKLRRLWCTVPGARPLRWRCVQRHGLSRRRKRLRRALHLHADQSAELWSVRPELRRQREVRRWNMRMSPRLLYMRRAVRQHSRVHLQLRRMRSPMCDRREMYERRMHAGLPARCPQLLRRLLRPRKSVELRRLHRSLQGHGVVRRRHVRLYAGCVSRRVRRRLRRSACRWTELRRMREGLPCGDTVQRGQMRAVQGRPVLLSVAVRGPVGDVPSPGGDRGGQRRERGLGGSRVPVQPLPPGARRLRARSAVRRGMAVRRHQAM